MFSRMKTYRIWRSWKVHINVAGRFGSCHFVYGRNVPDLGTLHATELGYSGIPSAHEARRRNG